MNLNRRTILATGAAAAAAFFSSTGLAEQPYPNHPITLVVPYTPGGGADGLARLVASKMATELGQPIIIDNKPGANTMLGANEVARAQPDGYTLLYVSSSFALNPSLYKVPYDTERAFAPVAMVAEVPIIIIANPNEPYKTVEDLVNAAKAKPGNIAYASYGLGSIADLGGRLLGNTAGVEITSIPYKGSAPALNDLLGGHVPIAFSSIEPALQLIAANKVYPIAVLSKKRIQALPNVPTVAETYPGFEAVGWNGIVAPINTPAPIMAKLNAAINKAIGFQDVQQIYAKSGVEAYQMTPEEFGKLVKDEIAKWGGVIRKAGIKVE